MDSPSTTSSAKKLAALTGTIAWSEFKLRYAGSALGYFWSLAKPLMLFTVLYTVFHKLLRLGEGVEHFPEMLLLGIVMWTFFAESTLASVSILVTRADLLRKVAFPAIVLPVSVALTAVMAMLFNLVAVLALLAFSDIHPTVSWFWIPLLFIELFAVTIGVSLILSALYVNLRDIGQLWDVLSQLLFYATPIIYPITLLTGTGGGDDGYPLLARLALLNPMGQIIEQTKRILVLGESGSIADVLPGAWYAAPPLIAVGLLTVGVLVFQRSSYRMVESL